MYQTTVAQSAGALAMTGAVASAYQVIGAWTLVLAGVALVTVARVLSHRARSAAR